jgi:hypothetical protein
VRLREGYGGDDLSGGNHPHLAGFLQGATHLLKLLEDTGAAINNALTVVPAHVREQCEECG